MDKDISQPCDLFPWYFCIPISEIFVYREPLIISNSSLPRRRESSYVMSLWIPAFAGMTFLEVAYILYSLTCFYAFKYILYIKPHIPGHNMTICSAKILSLIMGLIVSYSTKSTLILRASSSSNLIPI